MDFYFFPLRVLVDVVLGQEFRKSGPTGVTRLVAKCLNYKFYLEK
jgi:hypothetical protein